MEYGVYVTVAALAVTIIGHAVRVTWALRGVEKDLKEHFSGHIETVNGHIEIVKADIMNRSDIVRREFGETGSALRTKIHEIETWNRDTFVRKDSFEIVINRIEKSMEKIGDRVDEKLDKIDGRIEMFVRAAKDKT